MEFVVTTNQGYMFIVSFLLTVGSFYLILFFAFSKKVSYIFFSLLCFLHIFKILIRLDQRFLLFDPSWENTIESLKHVPFILGGICLIGFLIFEFNLKQKSRIISIFILLLMTLYLLGIPSFGLIIFYALGVAAYALKKDRTGGIYAIIGLLVFALITRLEVIQQLGIAYYLGIISFIVIMTLLVGQRIKMTLKAQREALLKSSKLENQLLKTTIQPHFIMNSLTSLQELIETDPKEANRFIENLAEEFRLFNLMADQKLISIAQELSLCRTHLEIMNQRKQGTFKLETHNISGNEQVPPGMFHTLLENGLTHGFRKKQTGNFRLEKSLNGETVSYHFSNDGALSGIEDGLQKTKYGTGFKYVTNRLMENFGNAWSLKTDLSGGEFSVIISIPQ